jgi:hypothetical protein
MLLCKDIEEEIISYENEDNKKLLRAERKNKVKYKMKKNKILHNEALYHIRNYEGTMAY